MSHRTAIITAAACAGQLLFVGASALANGDDDPCPRHRCGDNAPHLTEAPLGQLNLDGVRNSYGVRVEYLRKAGVRYRLRIENGAFVGYDDDKRLAGQALIGSDIVLSQTEEQTQGGSGEILIRITEFRTVGFWRPTAGSRFPSYHLLFRRPSGADTPEGADEEGWTELCYHPPKHQVADGLERWSTPVRGRYKHLDLSLRPDSREQGWFNFACAGQALFKMKRHGYEHDHHSDEARQATLRMITAAYCQENSWSYTEYGTSILWQNRENAIQHGALELDSNVADIEAKIGRVEAVWTKDGAACLSAARIPKSERAQVADYPERLSVADALSPCNEHLRKSIARCAIEDGDTLGDVLGRYGGEWITVTPMDSQQEPNPPVTVAPRSGCAGCGAGGPGGHAGSLVLWILLAAVFAALRKVRHTARRSSPY